MTNISLKPTAAFVIAAWSSLVIGAGGFVIGLWNATMQLNEKGYYLLTLLFGLYAAVTLQKVVRDRLEGIAVTRFYSSISWAAFVTALMFLVVGLWNASLELAEKGFYGMSFVLSLFASAAVQKNIRDLLATTPVGPEGKTDWAGDE